MEFDDDIPQLAAKMAAQIAKELAEREEIENSESSLDEPRPQPVPSSQSSAIKSKKKRTHTVASSARSAPRPRTQNTSLYSGFDQLLHHKIPRPFLRPADEDIDKSSDEEEDLGVATQAPAAAAAAARLPAGDKVVEEFSDSDGEQQCLAPSSPPPNTLLSHMQHRAGPMPMQDDKDLLGSTKKLKQTIRGGLAEAVTALIQKASSETSLFRHGLAHDEAGTKARGELCTVKRVRNNTTSLFALCQPVLGGTPFFAIFASTLRLDSEAQVCVFPPKHIISEQPPIFACPCAVVVTGQPRAPASVDPRSPSLVASQRVAVATQSPVAVPSGEVRQSLRPVALFADNAAEDATARPPTAPIKEVMRVAQAIGDIRPFQSSITLVARLQHIVYVDTLDGSQRVWFCLQGKACLVAVLETTEDFAPAIFDVLVRSQGRGVALRRLRYCRSTRAIPGFPSEALVPILLAPADVEVFVLDEALCATLPPVAGAATV